MMISGKVSAGCRVCGGTEVEEWLHPSEMMFGMREQFAYFRCATCGCLQLNEIPRDMSRFYPDNYYSFQKVKTVSVSLSSVFKRDFLNRSMTRHVLGWRNFFGHLFCHLVDHPNVPVWLRFLARPVPFDCAILDVGCGSGASLVELYECGFTNLLGVDPYIAKSLQYEGGIRIEKCELAGVRGKYDLVMFHHVLEHLEQPLKALQSARKLLAPGGQIMVRIPLSDSAATQKYREKWVQLDAPRHITLQTRKSMEFLAQKAGLKVTRVTYDSFAFQFWGSEQYLADIPLMDPRSQVFGTSTFFSSEQLAGFVTESALLNQQEKGDQAAFILEAGQA